MAERFNGNVPFRRKNHGSDRRGIRGVPDYNHASSLQQSRADQERTLAAILERRDKALGIGNRNLPAFKHKFELVENIDSYKAVVVGGETGSGKSTQLPQYLYEAGYDLTIVLVPRRVIADGLGERIREEMAGQLEDFKPDEEVGIIHGERVEKHENNRILVMTPNTYIKMAKEFEALHGDKKVAIIADEIHEANLFTELAVGVAAKSVEEHDTWRIVAASATHNAETLEGPFQKINEGYVPKVQIEGRPFNVELVEEEKLNPMQAYAKYGEEHEKAMIFTSGKKEIEHIIDETKKELEKKEKGSSQNVIFRILHGELTERELSHINEPIPEGYRLCIVSSPAGMSGITIPGVTMVATDGTINRAELDDDDAEGLARRYLSKAGIIQQIGRAGRDVPGGVGYLCAPVVVKSESKTKKTTQELMEEFVYRPFEGREAHEPPEIWHTNLSRAALSMSALDFRLFDINSYIPHKMKQIDILNAEEALYRLGALREDATITQIGKSMDRFPISPELSRGLHEVFTRQRSLEMARAAFIAGALGSGGLQDFMAKPAQQKAAKELLRDTTKDDFVAQLDIMSALYERMKTRVVYDGEMREMGLSPKRVNRAMKVARKALATEGLYLHNLDITPPTSDEEQQIRDDFSAGFIDMTYQYVGKEARSKQPLYRNIHGNKDSTKRKVSNRSFASVKEGAHIAGIPRWYNNGIRKDGTPIKHDIVDLVMPVDPTVISKWAVQHGVTQRQVVSAEMRGAQVVERQQEFFGSITVATLDSDPNEIKEGMVVISEKAQKKLAEYIINHPDDALRALRDLVKDLGDIRTMLPPDELEKIRRHDAPEDITNHEINEYVEEFAKHTTYAHEVDEMLRQLSFSRGFSLSRYYSPEDFLKAKERSPDVLAIAGTMSTVRYKEGVPYVSGLTRQQKRAINWPVYLADGREVFWNKPLPDGTKELVSMETLKTD